MFPSIPHNKYLNNVTKPILFVAIMVGLMAFFADLIKLWDWPIQFLLVGLPISFVVFYYFGKQHDGLQYVLSLFLIALAWDLVLPPYQVDLIGNISSSALLAGTSTDFFIGNIWHTLGFSGPLLFIMTYPVSFAILFSGAVLLLKSSKK